MALEVIVATTVFLVVLISTWIDDVAVQLLEKSGHIVIHTMVHVHGQALFEILLKRLDEMFTHRILEGLDFVQFQVLVFLYLIGGL